ncbi:ribosomal protein S18-alanine N-acetyltransferase [Bartonella sp. DGB2]|uniref:ribosomal protein S18-alanine N-acetyltransferase n=1 Tax=Bartonella sp. DGB2 TaxID=3388426 RepID=UPI00398FC25B
MSFRRKDLRFLVAPASDEDGVHLADIHQLVFNPAWDGAVFEQLLRDPYIFVYVGRAAIHEGSILGFILCRHVLDEAEILSFAIHPKFQKRGLGSLLMDTALRKLYYERIRVLFLEVAADNQAALTLYRRFGFQEVGRRPAYYQAESGCRDALSMRLCLM